MKKIIWIASYPKSGNTYVRAFLSHYLYPKNIKTDFSLLKKIPKFERKETFEKILNKKIFNENFDFLKYSQEVQSKLIKNFQQKELIYKTHYFYGSLNNYTFTSKKNTLLFIYIVRDPREVLISYAYHNNISIDEQLKDFTSSNIINVIGSETIVNWSLHYKSWKSFINVPSIFLKYEDLVLNPKKNFEKLINFLSQYIDIDLDTKILNQAIQKTQFTKLKKLEKSLGFQESNKKGVFFRSGKIDSWKKILSKDQKNKVEKAFYSEMKKLNYIKK
ncbi:MAG: hypothetical protein CFH18_00673 [Alphaproteobacteria bacterium MarineAlpha5_Bin8]|nr:MAG: hypothetical protein CFH17_00168 [Alphaproteobacteria bacterium MarineAlpha5_Bin7]PPR46305.1 MAG: hypothetical protein CFH18_00673 [Alphaproteobacteria bacterium MarineAlpha5_Bin8]PPR54890.1 MAG: hypothetical protein CFH16_00067 [Alphaproteobacteria bacterium MarineAlpha5_Bin6]